MKARDIVGYRAQWKVGSTEVSTYSTDLEGLIKRLERDDRERDELSVEVMMVVPVDPPITRGHKTMFVEIIP